MFIIVIFMNIIYCYRFWWGKINVCVYIYTVVDGGKYQETLI